MKEIRLGTIGSGMIVKAILNHVQHMEGIYLEAVYSRSRETGTALAQAYGASKVYTDMAAFLADPAVNTVYIASPNSLHYSQTKQALLAGKHVICEKPFCTQASQARELVALAEEKNLLLIDATPTAFLPNLEPLQQALPKVGQVRLVLSSYSQYSSRYDKLLAGELPNVFNPAFAGGCLMDINFYNVYLNVTLFGKPDSAVYYPNIHKSQVDTSGILIMQYPGFVCQCAGAKDTWGVNTVQIQGETGYIYVTGGSNGLSEITVVTKTTREQFNLQHNPDRWYYEVEAITRLLLSEDRQWIRKRLNTMVTVMEVLEQTRKAAGIRFPQDDPEK